MKAKAGDQLLAGSGSTGLIIDVLGSDGQPPYVVKWLQSDHLAMVVPDPYARIIPRGCAPACDEARPANENGRAAGLSCEH